jgi:hypothetical protein
VFSAEMQPRARITSFSLVVSAIGFGELVCKVVILWLPPLIGKK